MGWGCANSAGATVLLVVSLQEGLKEHEVRDSLDPLLCALACVCRWGCANSAGVTVLLVHVVSLQVGLKEQVGRDNLVPLQCRHGC